MASILGPMASEDGSKIFMRKDVNQSPVENPGLHPERQIFKAHILVNKMNCLNCIHKYFTNA
jgi:hypothetical protein